MRVGPDSDSDSDQAPQAPTHSNSFPIDTVVMIPFGSKRSRGTVCKPPSNRPPLVRGEIFVVLDDGSEIIIGTNDAGKPTKDIQVDIDPPPTLVRFKSKLATSVNQLPWQLASLPTLEASSPAFSYVESLDLFSTNQMRRQSLGSTAGPKAWPDKMGVGQRVFVASLDDVGPLPGDLKAIVKSSKGSALVIDHLEIHLGEQTTL